LISLGLHGLAALVLWGLFSHFDAVRPPLVEMETRVPAARAELSLLIMDPAQPLRTRKQTGAAGAQEPSETSYPVLLAASRLPSYSSAPVSPAFSRDNQHPEGSTTGRPGSEAGGEKGEGVTTFFEVPARGRKVVYVIDRSLSMGASGRFAATKRQLRESLERLPTSACFQVVAYHSHPEVFSSAGRTDLLEATPEQVRQAAAWVEALTAEGGTNHFPALRRALALQPDVIYFLTDADDLQLAEVLAFTRLNGGRCVIHALELTAANRGHSDMPLQALARYNQGEYRGVDLRGPNHRDTETQRRKRRGNKKN
jgi:hypothetical protein